jgi:outer membrane protein OmpA-like peptidoglycan-associated protein
VSATPTPGPSTNLDPIPHQVNPNIPPKGVPVGGSVMLLNGAPVPVVVVPNAPQSPTGLDVLGDGFTMRLFGRGDDADPLGLGEKDQLILQSPQVPVPQRESGSVSPRSGALGVCEMRRPEAVSSGTGFQPGSQVKMYILPTTYLGAFTVDASGTYSGSLPVPVGVQLGEQTLQVNGYASSGVVRSLSLGIQVTPARAMVTRQLRAQVFFDALSPVISAEGKKALDGLVRTSKKRGVRTISLGFVQQTRTTSNDLSLSTQRAQNVAAYLRGRGLTGSYVVRGDGVAGPGASARRVNVEVTYQSGCQARG